MTNDKRPVTLRLTNRSRAALRALVLHHQASQAFVVESALWEKAKREKLSIKEVKPDEIGQTGRRRAEEGEETQDAA